MRIKAVLNILFEAGAATAFFAGAWSSYTHASGLPSPRPEANAMAAGLFIGGAISLLMLARSLLALRRPPTI
jgi:hypothetical protein